MKSHTKDRNGFLLLLSLLVFYSFILIGYKIENLSHIRSVRSYICHLVFDKIYEKSDRLVNWKQDCLTTKDQSDFNNQISNLIAELNRKLSLVGISHLEIYSPQEDQKLWNGKNTENGMILRFFENQLFVIHVKDGSPAYNENIQLGDVIVDFNNETEQLDQMLNYKEGLFHFKSRNIDKRVYLKPKTFKIDNSPKIRKLTNDIALLTISSFREEYFNKIEWKNKIPEFLNFNKVVIDLRGNRGGSFISMLRALSPFLCSNNKEVGSLHQPRKNKNLTYFEDNDDPNYIYSTIKNHSLISLRAFEGYSCFDGELRVLVDSMSSSVSEIFAVALQNKERAKIIGQTTSGQVVMGVWYDLPIVGKGFSISIPEALFLTNEGVSLEGVGVTPDLYSDYRLNDLLIGQDSYIIDGVKN